MLKISRDHPTFLLKPSVSALCENFLQQHGLNYFQFLRCYDDGACSLLTNETGLFEFMSTIQNKPVVFSAYTQEHEKMHSYWFHWDESLPEAPVRLAREKFGLHQGITYVRRAKNYYDMIAFALPKPKDNPASFYMTKNSALMDFICRFDRYHQDLIRDIAKNPLALPKPYRDVNYQKICLHKQKIDIQSPAGIIHITPQELACLRLLAQQATYKQIGANLKLSPRTVESYIMRFKLRAGISTRSELEKLAVICT